MSEQNQTEHSTVSAQSELSASISWLRNIAVLIAAVFRLGMAEISLAKEDFGRLVLVCVLIVPIFLLTWVALSVMLAWIVYELSMSALLGFTTFAAIQLATSLILLRKFKTYRRNLSLPATRAQISMIIEEVRHEASQQSPADRNA